LATEKRQDNTSVCRSGALQASDQPIQHTDTCKPRRACPLVSFLPCRIRRHLVLCPSCNDSPAVPVLFLFRCQRMKEQSSLPVTRAVAPFLPRGFASAILFARSLFISLFLSLSSSLSPSSPASGPFSLPNLFQYVVGVVSLIWICGALELYRWLGCWVVR